MRHNDNPWALFSTMAGWRKAHHALEAAWRKAAKLATAQEIVAHMLPVMQSYREFGAMDTEPLAELDRRIEVLLERN